MKTAKHKAFPANCKLSPDDQRTVIACISSIAVDREGDVLIPQGCNSKDFEANPVVMLMHSYWTLPVGKVTDIKRTEDEVVATIEFAERPANHPDGEEWLPDTLFSLYQQGVMNAFSVGFIPTDIRAASSRDIAKYGDECRQVINRWKLLELSAVPIPCNQTAVSLAVSKGYVTAPTAAKLFGESEAGDAKSPEGDTPAALESALPAQAEVASVPPTQAKAARTVVTVVDKVDKAEAAAPKPRRVVYHVIPDAPAADVDVAVSKRLNETLQKRKGRIYLLD